MLLKNKLEKISAVVSVVLVGLFLTVLLRDEPKLSNPLINMNVEQEVKRNATYESSSPVITGTIDKNITKGTYILRGQAIVPKGAIVTILPETTIYADRDASFVVEGKLSATKVALLSNQAHLSKQYWYGLIAKKGGEITLSESTINNATAAITADEGGKIMVKNSDFQNNVASVVTMPGSTAEITDSKIEGGTVGIQIIGGSPLIKNIVFKTLYDGLRIFHTASPNISDITLSSISHEIIHYLAEQDLTINRLIFVPTEDITKLIYDGKNQPLHTWQNQQYKTGIVIINN